MDKISYEDICKCPHSGVVNKDVKAEDEGETHINVYSQSNFTLGKFLSNFAHAPFLYKNEEIASVEGLWYAKITGKNELKQLSGFEAKKAGRKFDVIADIFSEIEMAEIYICKLLTYPAAKKALLENKLPLVHYYMFNNVKKDANDTLWLAKLWEKIAFYLKENKL